MSWQTEGISTRAMANTEAAEPQSAIATALMIGSEIANQLSRIADSLEQAIGEGLAVETRDLGGPGFVRVRGSVTREDEDSL